MLPIAPYYAPLGGVRRAPIGSTCRLVTLRALIECDEERARWSPRSLCASRKASVVLGLAAYILLTGSVSPNNKLLIVLLPFRRGPAKSVHDNETPGEASCD